MISTCSIHPPKLGSCTILEAGQAYIQMITQCSFRRIRVAMKHMLRAVVAWRAHPEQMCLSVSIWQPCRVLHLSTARDVAAISTNIRGTYPLPQSKYCKLQAGCCVRQVDKPDRGMQPHLLSQHVEMPKSM